MLVVYKDIGMEFNGMDVQGLGKEPKEVIAVIIIPEDVSSFVPAASYVIHRARILDTQRPGHGSCFSKISILSTIKI